ncbi:TraB/GumN family protein [Vibrio viridaestus]|uniref:TraB/GumN family protein n=1 Tax=Vibrio viridaestus TaxID=2487322 RepID=A0A3N9TK82_9VIBR|nr:TraB/GumN family protein [Vibrio viridaestus]RQW63975.1 TraB/GumN family protein [Vibrio viridaestus]
MSLKNWLTSGILFFSCFGHASPLYWTAEKGNLHYLLIGTVHVGQESMYPLPNDVMKFLRQSRALILEADLSEEQTPVYPTSDTSVKDVLNESQLQQLSQIAQQLEVSFRRLENMPPWSAALTIQMTQLSQLGYTGEYGVDRHMIAQAQNNNLPILGLETLQSQVDMLSEQQDNGKELLVSAIDNWKNNENDTLCLIKSWQAGDRKNLAELVKQAKMSKQLSNALETNRNTQWAEKLSSADFLPDQNGKYVIAVGLLHLIGSENLIDQLKQRGFTVKLKGKREHADCQFLGS